MPTTAHTHCALYWEREESLLLKLLYYFHKLVVLYTAPKGRRCARACLTLLAALIRD